MSAPKAVLIKGPSVNSRVYMTALPAQHEVRSVANQDLISKARELFHVPTDHTPYLCVAAPAVSGSPISDARGAILMPDAMPFIRDREILTLRWAPSSPRKAGNRVHWDAQLEYDTPRAEHRGAEARVNHVARTLERERKAAELMLPTKPISPPPSSPDVSEDAPGSPTPLRGGHKSLWPDEVDLAEKAAVRAESEPAEQPVEQPAQQKKQEGQSRLSALSSWCAVLNPFSKSSETAAEEAEAAEILGHVEPVRTSPPPPATVATMTKVLNGLLEHPCSVHLKEHMPEEFMRFSMQRGRAVDLHTIGERIARSDFPQGAALGHFVKDLTLFWDNVRAFYGTNTSQGQEAASLGRFATMLLGELQRPQIKRAQDSEDVMSAPDGKRQRRSSARSPYATRRTATR